MSNIAPRNTSRRPRWIIALGAVVTLVLGVLLLPPMAAFSAVSAWKRMRLRRAVQHEWRDQSRFVVRDDRGVWRGTIRGEWLPGHASATIVVPGQGRESDWSAEERLGWDVLNEWGSLNKGSGWVLAVVVAPGAEPIAVRLPRWYTLGVDAERDRALLLERLQTMAELGGTTVRAAT